MIETWLIAAIPSVICGGVLWYLKRYFDKRDKREEAAEKTRVQNNVLLLKGVSASLALSEATAGAIERSDIVKCNGEMAEAKRYAVTVKHEIKDFMYCQGSEHVI